MGASPVVGRTKGQQRSAGFLEGNAVSQSAEAARAGHLMNVPPDNDPRYPGKEEIVRVGMLKRSLFMYPSKGLRLEDSTLAV